MFWFPAIASHSFTPLALGDGHFEGSIIHKSIEQLYIRVVTRILFCMHPGICTDVQNDPGIYSDEIGDNCDDFGM